MWVCALLTIGASGLVLAADDASADNSGISFGLVYDGAEYVNLSGGVRRAGTYASNLNLQLTLDLDRLLGWSETTLYADGLWLAGGQPSTLVGDAQGISRLAAPATTRLYELWLQKNFAEAHWSLLLGLYDLNSEFDRSQAAGLFLNSSFGIGPEFSQTGIAGPSVFPSTSIAFRAEYKPAPGIVLRAAALDGAPINRTDGRQAAFQAGDGALLVAEVAILGRPGPVSPPAMPNDRLGRLAMLPPYDDKVSLGIWHYTAAFDDLVDVAADGLPVRRRGSTGAYLIADHLIARDAADSDKRTSAFLQLGLGDARVNRFGSYLGIGLVRSGILGRPASDEVGLALAMARNGSHYMKNQQQQGIPAARWESAVELTYLTQVTPWLALQPDLQWVIHPNTDPGLRNALAFTLRFEVALGK